MHLPDYFKRIRTFAFDMDGVLTDGTLLILENNQYIRRMHTKDGYALQLAIKKGYRVVIISGSNSDQATSRFISLGVRDVFMKVEDKSQCLSDYVEKHGLIWDEVLFMGDDIPDYTVMQKVGLACAPADAVTEIKEIARYIAPLPGGQGCVRDVIEKVLKMNDDWDLDTSVPSR